MALRSLRSFLIHVTMSFVGIGNPNGWLRLVALLRPRRAACPTSSRLTRPWPPSRWCSIEQGGDAHISDAVGLAPQCRHSMVGFAEKAGCSPQGPAPSGHTYAYCGLCCRTPLLPLITVRVMGGSADCRELPVVVAGNFPSNRRRRSIAGQLLMRPAFGCNRVPRHNPARR